MSAVSSTPSYYSRDVFVTRTALVLLVLLVITGTIYLIIANYSSRDAAAQIYLPVRGLSDLVFPGPGDNTPGVYWEGHIILHLTKRFISWRISHGLLGTVHAIEVIGPINPDKNLEGPVYLTLCGGASSIACLSTGPHVLEQKIIMTSPEGQPLDDYMDIITSNKDVYRLRVKTQNFPDGALVSRLL